MKKITLLLSLLITSIGFGQNLLTNGDFEQGATAWAGNAFNAVDDGSGSNNRNEANVATAGNPWDVSLNQPVTLVAGTQYQLSYTAYTDATTGTRSMTAGIGRNEPDWSALTSNPALTATPTTFTYIYTVNYANPATSRVVFDMGAETGYVFIDDVSLVAYVDTTAPTAFTATAGTVSAFSVELLLTATDDSGNVTYDVAYTNSGAQTATVTGVSAQATSLVIGGLTPQTAYTFAVSASDATGNTATNNPISIAATTIADTSTACAGTSSDVQQGTLNGTYDYAFETLTNGDVRMTFELATAVTGLVAYAWRETPFQETPMTVTGKAATIDLTGLTSGNDISYGVKFVWAAGGLAVTKYFTYTVGDDCSTAGLDGSSLSSVKMYPNPASGIVKFSTALGDALSVSVFDLLGKLVIPVQTIQSELNISNLNPGVYFVRMEQGASSITKKLLVK
ncbi:T9SS type A sorting domain-containing protein [Flavobacteriaceae bacterium]|nr:T9SS type A sorting domain-containing protein [Flavobacteriaceae bacterium]